MAGTDWLVALLWPPLFPLAIAGSLVGRLALRAGQASRLLIASSREFVADAQASEWTRNPAALAAALLKVDGYHRVALARPQDDAMMIAGDSHGRGATHPTVAQRITALARVTGSMVFNAPGAPTDADWTAETSREAVEHAALGRGAVAAEAFVRIRQGDGENLLGLTPLGTAALLLTMAGLAWLHPNELGDRRALAARFDPRPLGAVMRWPAGCGAGPFMPLLDPGCRIPSMIVTADGTPTPQAGKSPIRQPYRGQSGLLPITTVLRSADGLYVAADGSERFGLPKELEIAEVDRVGCFVQDPRPIERTGPLPLTADGPGGQSVAELRMDADELAREVQSDRPDAATLSYYIDRREALVDEAYALYGHPGLEAARAIFADKPSAAALERLRWIASAIGTVPEITTVQQAKLRALLRNPDKFVPCRSLASPRTAY